MFNGEKDNFISRQESYEQSYEYRFTKRLPIVSRISCKSILKHAIMPFDKLLSDALGFAMLETSRQVNSSIFSICFLDELNIVLWEPGKNGDDFWLDNRVQDMSSTLSSYVTHYFNSFILGSDSERADELIGNPFIFRAKSFLLPNLDEVVNNMIFRQNIYMLKAVELSSIFELSKKYGYNEAKNMVLNSSTLSRVNMLEEECGVLFENMPSEFRKGMMSYRAPKIINDYVTKNRWFLDTDPVILSDNRQFLENILVSGADIVVPNRDL